MIPVDVIQAKTKRHCSGIVQRVYLRFGNNLGQFVRGVTRRRGATRDALCQAFKFSCEVRGSQIYTSAGIFKTAAVVPRRAINQKYIHVYMTTGRVLYLPVRLRGPKVR